MFKKNLKFVLGLALATATIVVSCKKKDSDVGPAYNTKATSALEGTGCENCCSSSGTDSLSGAPVAAAQVGNPGAYTDLFFNFCDGEVDESTDAHIVLNKQFNSFVGGLNGWKVDYLDSANVAYSTTLSTITCSSILSNKRTNGNGGSYANFMGQNSSAYGLVGWYTYTPPGGPITPTKLLLVWKDCDASGTLNTGDKAYVVRVGVFPKYSAGPPATYHARIGLEYRCYTINC